MDTIDYVYRFDPKNPSVKEPPADAEAARATLEDGNRMFSRWIRSCQARDMSTAGARYVVHCNDQGVGMVNQPGQLPVQAPFAVVVGCSDARVPMEMLFGQGFNDLFVVRVAGNVLGDVCKGSIDFALAALSQSVRVVVLLGHSGCGAVGAAVDSYLDPSRFWARSTTPMLRTIQERIFVAVREAANAIQSVWGDDAPATPGYRAALIESAVALNAAQAAFGIRQEVEEAGKPEVRVLFGVFNLHTNQVCMPVVPGAPVSDENVRLADAPADLREIQGLALTMAEILRPRQDSPPGPR